MAMLEVAELAQRVRATGGGEGFVLHPATGATSSATSGPNGAGKTTTLRMLATLLEPTAGTAIINGVDIVKENPKSPAPSSASCPTSSGLYEGITAYEYLAFFAEAYGIPPAERKQVIENVLELTDLTVKRGRQCGDALTRDATTLVPCQDAPARPVAVALGRTRLRLRPPCPRRTERVAEGNRGDGQNRHRLVPHPARTFRLSATKIGIIEKGDLLLWGDVETILRQLQPAKLLTIRCLDGAEKLAEWLNRQPEIVNTQIVNGTVQAQFIGDDEAQAELLAASSWTVTASPPSLRRRWTWKMSSCG
jgi:ABC-2 type transport system ATP-binding protein